MGINTLPDNSHGTVHISSKPASPERASDQGFFSMGGGSGFSGGFGGSSRKRGKKRARARAQALAQARAKAQAAAQEQALEQARVQAAVYTAAQLQRVTAFTQTYETSRSVIDRRFSERKPTLESSLKTQLSTLKEPPKLNAGERWQLYLITQERNEIDTLLSIKSTELKEQSTLAKSFDGHDPLSRSAQDYLAQLAIAGTNQVAVNQAHQRWEQAYTAAQKAKELTHAIGLLNEKLNELGRHHAEQQIVWRAREQQWELRRQYVEQRQARIDFKCLADEQARHEWRKQANTLSVAMPTAPAGGILLTQAGALVEQGLTKIPLALNRAVKAITLARAASLLPTPVTTFVLGMLYSPELGNGELTPEQRSRVYEGMAVAASHLGITDSQNLKALADTGGSVELPYRIRAEPVQDGTQIIVVETGGAIPRNVPVLNAVRDPLSNTYTVTTSGVDPKQLRFSVPAVDTVPNTGGYAPATDYARLHFPEPVATTIPTGVDTRFNDCIVCIPGLPATYVSFGVPPAGMGVVLGRGQPATSTWAKAGTQAAGVAIPATVGNRMRGREFASLGAFNESMWRAIAQDPQALSSLSEVNQKRITQGFAPYAPKEQWIGERRELELRSQNPAQPYHLDSLSVSAPNGTQGVRPATPVYQPWSLTPVNLLEAGQTGQITWKPLIPAGSQVLGPTTLPLAPELPALYPGDMTDPVGSQNETLPAADPLDINVSIPGFGEDADLPSPDLMFAKPPVKPLEVGAYNEMRWRSRNDGMDIDHIVSRKALERYVLANFPDLSDVERMGLLINAPSIAIPTKVHQKFSETYGGRNTVSRQIEDAMNLRVAADRNIDALKPGLLGHGFSEIEIESARAQLHYLNKTQGWY